MNVKSYIKPVQLLLMLLFACNGAFSQFVNLGHAKKFTLQDLQSSQKEILGNKKLQAKKFQIEERKVDVNIPGKDSMYLTAELIIYQTPYRNLKNEFYFNEKGYCDSMVVTENACWDCSASEDGDKLLLYWVDWNRDGENTYRSKKPFFIGPEDWTKKTAKKEYAFAHLRKITNPTDGTCRKWILNLEQPADLATFATSEKSKRKK